MDEALILVNHVNLDQNYFANDVKTAVSSPAIEEASRFAQFLKNNFTLDPVLYHSSPFYCQQMGEILAEKLNLSTKESDKVGEIELAQKLKYDEVNEAFFGELESLFKGAKKSDHIERMKKALDAIKEDDLVGERVIITHRAIMAYFLSHYNEDFSTFYIYNNLKTCGYAVIDCENYKIMEFNANPLNV